MNRSRIARAYVALRSAASSVSFQSALIIGSMSIVLWKPALSDTVHCADVRFLVEQSTTNFSSIRKETKGEPGGLQTTFVLEGAEYCLIIEQVKTDSYRCTWKYSYGDKLAGEDFEKLASGIRECLGSGVIVREDMAVNHPDTYESYLLTLPGTAARISLKDKIEMKSTYVSFTIDGMQ